MPFNTPDLPTLAERAETDIEARLPGADARLRRSNLNVLGRLNAGATYGVYGFVEWIFDQMFEDTAENEMLDRRGSVWGITRTAATFATGGVDFTGTNGAQIPAATLLKRSDGVEYLTDALVTIAAGVATAQVTAVVAAAAGDAAASAQVSLVSPIAGITSQGAVAAGGLTGGTDAETDASLRSRLIDRIQQPPHGGADFDYCKWALEVAGVTRCWVYAKELGIGTVSVRFMMDDTYSDGIPLAADVTAVQAWIDGADKRPVTADVTVVAPVAVAINPEISGLAVGAGEDPATVKLAIEAELKDLLRREAIPGGTILLSHIREAVSIAAGENDHAVVVPAADVVHATGQIAVVGAIVWS